MALLERILGVAARLLVWAAGAFLLAMALHVCLDVAMKYFLNKPIPGTAEIVARYYMLAAVFLPLAFVELRNSGIAVDLFYNMFAPRWRRAMVALSYVGQMSFFSLLAYQSSLDALKSYDKQEYIDGQIVVYIWPATFFLPIGLWLVAAMSLLRLAQTLIRSDWEVVTTHSVPLDGGQTGKEAL
ncbi:TRAP transporter small permease [Salipiger abyssi]|uniref:TRAP transporter small permease protein n=1 Tax=Salipiger abyssi TaxID=1250539 RepID=A0A1P8V0S8_9RHOB|nr:TRAP transporter small permease [Salipiger abyssi]APZ55241.1 TRAP-type C4-dicarboxylate transport system, small permease component [Salipiger abyssi]